LHQSNPKRLRNPSKIATETDIIPLQHKGTINSNMYLILEVKGKGKTHEAIDYVAVTLGELFAGRDYKIFLLISKLFFVILLISFV
jgi:hypothetical protein